MDPRSAPPGGAALATAPAPLELLRTTLGDFPLAEYRLRLAGREWTILHTGAILSHHDEARLLEGPGERLPYGVALWPASIALAHHVAAEPAACRARRVLELGAGTGLPGIVAASLGARVVQTDRHEVPLSVCRRNGARNGADAIEYRLADWTAWDDDGLYDRILGSDVLYAEALHPELRRILERNLAPGGRVVLADPFRAPALRLLESLAAEGWSLTITRWNVGEEDAPRAIGVYELAPPP